MPARHLVEKHQGIEGLILRRRRHVDTDRQIGEKRAHRVRAHNQPDLPSSLDITVQLEPQRPARTAAEQVAFFDSLFAAEALQHAFVEHFATTPSKGVDRLNGFQFAPRAAAELLATSRRIYSGSYRFSPYLEILKPKGRNKAPRLIGIPTIRDRVVLSQLNNFLAGVFPDQIPRNVASTYVRTIATNFRTAPLDNTWVCSIDIKAFYDSIDRGRLLKAVARRTNHPVAMDLIRRSLLTPTVPSNTRRAAVGDYCTTLGVPQGLAISNILASIYMLDVDKAMSGRSNVSYYRYVDDVLMFGPKDDVRAAYRSLVARLRARKLGVHSLGSGKAHMAPLKQPFGYLGYYFNGHHTTVRDTTVERFLQTIAARFSDFIHNKSRRLERFAYLNEARLSEIFLDELNERLTGAISGRRRYGWIAYFNQITDQTLLHKIDHTVARFFERLPEFERTAPPGLKRIARAYWEIRFNPRGGYVRDYDRIATRAQKIEFLVFRGRIGPNEALTDDQINTRFDRYRWRVLSAMHADEGAVY